MKRIELNFRGYWMEVNKNGIPDASGIYCVYACTYNAITDKVSIRELIYVGESDNIWNRISNHERLADWKKRLRSNETLCYSFAGVGENDAALRAALCEQLGYLGITIDAEKNGQRGKELEISAADSKVKVFVIPTNEELMIAMDTAALVEGK